MTVEQYVKANNRDEAFDICLDKGGIIHDKINRHLTNEDFVICEIGGTVGDIESLPFLEAIRQYSNEAGTEKCLFTIPCIAISSKVPNIGLLLFSLANVKFSLI